KAAAGDAAGTERGRLARERRVDWREGGDGELLVVVLQVHLEAVADLAQVGGAGGGCRLAAGGGEDGGEDRGQHGNDRDHDQQLDQGEPTGAIHGFLLKRDT